MSAGFDFEDYLTVAGRLAQVGDEASRRSAISRAYYAAYHAAARYVRAKNILVTDHTHQKVWGELAGDVDPARSKVGVRGQRLKSIRVAADYEVRFPGDLAKKMRQALAESRALVSTLDQLP